MTTYTDVFTGDVVQPTDVSYQAVDLSAGDVTLTWPIPRILDVSGSTGSNKIILPNATQASVGQDVLINNLGANVIPVYADDGLTVVGSVGVGKSAYQYLTDNSTANGAWTYVDFASTSTSATAAGLQGFGVRAISTSPTVLSAAHPVTGWGSSSYSTALSDRASLINYTGGGAAVLNLIAANAEDNYFFLFRNSGSASVALTPDSGLIDDAASKSIPQTNACLVCFDGTNWWTVGYGQNASFAFQASTLILTGVGSDPGPDVVAASSLGGYNSAATIISFTGTPTGNIILTFPASVQSYIFNNNATMGAYTIGVRTVSGATVTYLSETERQPIYCDGNELLTANSPTTTEVAAATVVAVAAAEAYALAMSVALG